MSPNAIAALHALRDLGAISARWTNPGYRELRQRNLAHATLTINDPAPVHRLTPLGKQLAARIII